MKYLHCIYVPGLNDQYWLNLFLVSLLPKFWKYFGVKTHIFLPRWKSDESYEAKENRLLVLVDSLLRQKISLFLIGQSAGGSIVLNVFSKRKDSVIGVINVAGRLRRGVQVFPSLLRASRSSFAFQTSVEMCEDVAQKGCTIDDRKRMMTIRPLWDEVVPSSTVTIPGARNYIAPLFEHTLGGCGILLFYSSRLFSFIQNICMDKEFMRKSMITRRRAQSLVVKKSSDTEIQRRFFERAEWNKASIVCVYVSLLEEVDTTKLIKYLLDKKKCVVVPKVLENESLGLFQIYSQEDLVIGRFGVLEPRAHCNAVDKKLVELFVVPGIAFDRKGNRLGWGKGYYDRLLQNIRVSKIALAYSFQLVDEISFDNHDIRMTSIITEKEVIDIH